MTALATVSSESAEVLYPFDELFFSFTDTRGVIRSGNDVFQRVSGYEWQELRGAPHRIVRHPGMPKAVFWTLWDTLKRDRPIGAYVCNKTKSGGYYWVFAVVTPVPSGYLSIRLRPSSPLFTSVKDLYETRRAGERTGTISPEESAKALLDQLTGQGFGDYKSFMAIALGREMEARDAALGRAKDMTIQCFWDLLEISAALLKHSDAILSAFLGTNTVPVNMRIISARLGQSGAPFSVLAVNYSALANSMKLALDGFQTLARAVQDTIVESFFLSCTARLQREMLVNFDVELATAANQRLQERVLLREQEANYTAKAVASLQRIRRQTAVFQDACSDMTRLAAGLEVTRVMGTMECSYEDSTREKLEGLLEELGRYQRTISTALAELDFASTQIQEATGRMVRIASHQMPGLHGFRRAG